MIHTSGFLEDQDPSAAFVNMAALVDSKLFTQGDDLRVPALNNIVAVAGGTDNSAAHRIRLDSPTLDEQVRYEITPLNVVDGADAEPGSPQAVDDLRESPLVLGVDEILHAQVLSTPGAAFSSWAIIWFADGPVNQVRVSRTFTLRLTGTTTVTAQVLTQCNLTPDENLRPGDYQILGMRFEGATAVMGRIILRTGNSWRPGVLGCDTNNDLAHPMFRHGGMGVWGEFPFTQTPALEALCNAADTAQTVHLDLVRVRG